MFMYGNILDYIDWRGDLSFENDPLNVVDAEVFAHLSYNRIESFVGDSFSTGITLCELAKRFKNSTDVEELSNMGLLINADTPALLYKCGESKRFGNVKISGLKSTIDFESQKQFAAMTFDIGNRIVVTFRGTDDYIVGWREDFNIAFMENIPGQLDALSYLQSAAKSFKKGIYVTGHSKGGNLALYAAAKIDKKIQKRIKGVFNLDGPGFSKDFFSTEGYLRIKSVTHSIYPSCDIVGMLFKHDDNYSIIKSDGRGVMQHDGLAWRICGNNFVQVEKFTEDSVIFEKAFNQWADNLTAEEKKKFVNALFDVLEAPGYRTLFELSENSLKASTKMLECFSKTPLETKKEIRRIFSAFMHVVKREIPMLSFLN